MACRDYRWFLLLAPFCGLFGLLNVAWAAPSMSPPALCFSLGEVAVRSYVSPRSKNRPAGRDAQRAHVQQVARKLGVELAPVDVDRIVEQAFYEPQISGSDFGLGVAADCLKRHAVPAAPERANVCFEVSRNTREFALNKRFIPLDRKLIAIDKIVADPQERQLTRELAQEVYRSNVSVEGAHGLAAEFYQRCLAPAGSKP